MPTKRTKPIESTIARLATGHGAQRLPPSLRTIEVRNVPSRGSEAGHKAFLKTVLPRIKYFNQHVEVVMQWREARARAEKAAGEEGKERQSSAISGLPPIVRVHFDDLPSQELPIAHKSTTEITRDLLALIQSTCKTPVLQERESSDELAALAEGEAGAATEGGPVTSTGSERDARAAESATGSAATL